jgi:hypothetical protein
MNITLRDCAVFQAGDMHMVSLHSMVVNSSARDAQDEVSVWCFSLVRCPA